MHKPIRVPVFALAILFGAVSTAGADVTLELRLPSSSAVAGRPVAVEIYAIAANETVGRLEAVIDWDPLKLSLIDTRVDPPSPTNPWQQWGFGTSGLNVDFSDGKALFSASAVPCQTLLATSGGALVAIMYFTALEPTVPTTSVNILPVYTDASGTFTTTVWDQLGPLFCGGVPYATVPLGPPVTITIFPCTDASNCVDGDACTDDACVAGVCVNTPNYAVGVECCNPGPDPNAHGTLAGDVEIIDDGSSCTSDSCDTGTGLVSHIPLGLGTECDTELNNACTPTHTCDGAGVCQPNHAQVGSFCDDQDECTQDSECDGAGNCVGFAFLPDTTPCSDGDDCTQGETCLNGVCQGGTDPCSVDEFCNPDGNDSTGVPCPPTCPTGQTCIDAFCRLPYACDQCRAGMGVVDCPDDGDCLLMSCVSGTCSENAPNDGVCQNGVFCDGHEFCQMQTPTNWTCQPAANPDPCSSTPSTPVCDEADDECVECLSSVDCDADPCLVEVCDTGLEVCESNPAPVDCSHLNEDCLIGVCQAVGGCVAFPVELIACTVSSDCSFFEPTRYFCINGSCATLSCDDGAECTSSDRCQSGVCAGDPPVSDGPVDLLWVPTSQSVDSNDAFTVDLFASLNAGTGENLNSVELLITWNPALIALTGNVDPCTATPCPPGQYDWSGLGSFFPIGGFDADGINAPCGNPGDDPCPTGCFNGRCNDGDAFLIAQRRLDDSIGAPVTLTEPLWITTIEFQALFPTGLSGTDVDVESCVATTVTRVIRAGGGADPIITGSLGSTNVVTGCLTNPDCNDGDACTDDTCEPDATCLSTPNYTVGIECCNPATGVTTVIDDVNDCTTDSCNQSNGVVTHTPVPLGTSCGSFIDTICDNPDSCDASGNCLANHEPDGFACADEGNECTDDICGSGICTHPNEPNGTPCGDQATNTTCNGADSCDGFGTCLDNIAPPTVACGDTSNTACTDPDMCDGAGNCDPKHAVAGTACGDNGDTDCDNPDSCDGAGNCEPNLEPPGTDCDDGVFCNGIDSCDATGSCLHAGPPCAACACITAVDCAVGACVPCVDCIDATSDICESMTQCPCDPPLVVSVGSRYLGVTPLPVDSGQPMRIRVGSPQYPCLSKYVGGPSRCGGAGDLCGSQANCNQCSQSGDPCLQDEDCFNFPSGEICVISGLQCVPGPVTPFDINGDSIPDGMLAVLADDPADAAELTPDGWGATLNRCSLSYAVCTTDDDCDHGVCTHAGCGTQICDTPCSVSAQNCSKFCDIPEGVGCDTNADCDPGGTCIEPICQRDETCIPGRVYITGPDIVPSERSVNGVITPTSYDVVVDCGGETAPVSEQMMVWCDVNGDQVPNFSDIQGSVFAFQGIFGRGNGIPNTLVASDLVGFIPCSPEQVPNVTDIGAQVSNFQGESYLGRLNAGLCADASLCDVAAQDCDDGSTCTRAHGCELPCVPR